MCEYLCKFSKKFEMTPSCYFRGLREDCSCKKPGAKNLVKLSLEEKERIGIERVGIGKLGIESAEVKSYHEITVYVRRHRH